ncbi:secretin N-terminal domain-containing protein, partial [Planctomycetota bacterium]
SILPPLGICITANAPTLAKAKAVLDVVDAPIRYRIETLAPLDAARDIAGNATIAAAVGGLIIGTFAERPIGKPGRLALIDVLGDRVIAIAPHDRLAEIRQAMHGKPQQRNQTDSPSSLAHPPRAQLLAAAVDQQRITDVQPYETSSHKHYTPSIHEIPGQAISLGQTNENESPAPEMGTSGTENDSDELLLNLKEKLTLVELLGLAGEYLNLTFLYKAEDVPPTTAISLMLHGKQRGSFKISELYPLLETVLKANDFVMTRKGSIVQIVPKAKAMEIDPQLNTAADPIMQGDVVVTRVFKLEHITPTNADKLLEQLQLGRVSTIPIDETKTLIVTDFAYRMPRIETILKLADTPGEPKRYTYRQLRFTMAGSLKEKISALAGQLGNVKVSITEKAPTVEKRRGESEASYQARLRAAQRVQAAQRPTPTKEPTDDAVYLDADERTNRILMIGREKQLALVNDLIDSLDVEQQDVRTLKPYAIENLEAAIVREKLEELGIVGPPRISSNSRSRLGSDPRTGTTQAQTQAQAQRTATALRTGTTAITDTEVGTEGKLDEPQVIVVEATNSLLVNATEEQHLQIQEILKHIDRETDAMSIPYRIHALKNQSPEELAAVLEKLILETVNDTEGKVERKIQKLEDEITVVPDEKSFSLIVYASPKNQEWIGNLIQELDRARPQVLIDVTLVEVTRNDEFTYDLNILNSVPDLLATSGQTSGLMGPIAEGVTGTDPYSLVQRLTDSGRNSFTDLQSASGNGVGFYGDNHINVLLETMDRKGYGRVLAKPKVLVNDGELGMIATTDTTYVLTQQGTVTPNSQNNVVQTAVNWDAYDAGITLEITPNINEGELLRLDAKLSRSDFLDTQTVTLNGNEVTSPPNTVTSDINTVVTVPDESTIILGGMLKLNQTKGGNKVPILGDIPLIGGLFRGINNKNRQSHLYVFVKAEIIRPSEVLAGISDLDRISEQHRQAFEEHEAEFQMYESWPGINAKPMGPKKILEAR